ncbi:MULTISPECIES: putative pilus system C39 family peptidase FilB [Acinetobacter]|jgi:predicted double-glycine peptidase|uniref:C39 family peptidase n=1 Tax=Acinetobacter towneri TaxID=202956 RepID=A0AB35M3J4_9GAMM|nr:MULTISPECIES: C39 family peptidase [Acinetobacter]MDM1719548.1 C39 family peptidase [Acinetobacter towneri]MDM1731687.1 C39 family peptidase [Acinetobacter towneri]MDM1734312.1 C39 family peptidase [Acinetobacter towneri]MDM1737113.1 C39 family peptidase [Acinetobacter towneri]MDM1739620.1 C39 family peptidase [Acinetobacter towneri]
MLEIALGSALIYYAATQAFDLKEQHPETVRYTETLDSRNNSFTRMHREPVQIKPALEDQFRGIVRQAYDYSCGSAALTTLLNGYVGTQLNEQQTMSGLLRYGEYDRIIERRSFSLLDMKRFVAALGMESGGYRGEFSDLVKQGQPAIVPISYAGFKHFVVYKAYKNGRVYVADPALGNISFDEERFKEVWENNTLFLINVAPQNRQTMLALQETDLRHVEDATVNRYAFVDIQYPQFAMEKIADKASTIRLERNVNKDSENYGQYEHRFLRLYYKNK